MTSPQGNPARREPLLWLQLLGLAALPLEAAALLIVLAGADPGPWPGLERVFGWSLGALAPSLLFWRLPPDLWSLVVVQVPLRGRRTDQLRLSALQTGLIPKALGAAGAVLLLPLLWWCDNHAGMAWSLSPFIASPRLVVLLLAALLLTLMLWQWQQIVQSLWLLSRPAARVAETLPLGPSDAAERRLNLGLPLLLLPALELPPAETRPQAQRAAPTDRQPQPEPEPITSATVLDSVQTAQNPKQPDTNATTSPAPVHDAADPEAVIEPQADGESQDLPEADPEAAPKNESVPDQSATAEKPAVAEESAAAEEVVVEDAPAAEAPLDSSVVPSAVIPVAIEPEQAAEDPEGGDLDQQV